MGNFLIFAYDVYYPNGGADDLKGCYNSAIEAMIALKKMIKVNEFDMYQFHSIKTGYTVYFRWSDDIGMYRVNSMGKRWYG